MKGTDTMKYETTFNVFTFPFHGGAKVWATKFFEEGKAELLQSTIKEFFECIGLTPTETSINEYVWFNDGLHAMLDEYKEECLERMV